MIGQSYRDYAGYLWREITQPTGHSYVYWLLGLSLLFWGLEIVKPWRRAQKRIRKDFWLDAFYMFFNVFLFSLIGFYALSNVTQAAFNGLVQRVFGVENLVAVEVGSWAPWAQCVVLFVARDFIHWNVHKLLHKSTFLWEFHKVHHSVEQLGFAAHLRYHWMENVVYKVLQYIPLGLIGFGLDDFFVVHIVSLTLGHFNHANISVPLGPFKYLFNNPQMHIWHHAKDLPPERQLGVNFGLSLSVWDYLFKTAWIPGSGRDIDLGFKDLEEFPSTFLGQTLYPASKRRRL